MAEEKKKFVIEIFRKKDPGELTAALADPEGKLDLGSAAALCGADACAMALRGAKLAAASGVGDEKLDYILRNLERLRDYFVYLIDEDVKGRNIMKRAVKEGDPQKIEAARQPAGAISDEVVCQLLNMIDLLTELVEAAPKESAVYLGSALEMAEAGIRSARLYLVALASGSDDETYRFIVRRENEIRLEELKPKAERLRTWVEERI